eukprot:TRINITY_DN4750_c0_g1_i1.p1 TRINITY_DN4750_c0_g1~~TRINITY_DN4750_c0_g1_i1.p1  ORF type:complete len:527 (+),score=121.91 TRINITY_DN4750_c0_g1_i1:60-1640(+)
MSTPKAARKATADLKTINEYVPPVYTCAYNARDLIIYALGVGARDLKFVYENDPEFSAIPTYPVVLNMKRDSFDIVPFGQLNAIPGLNYDPDMVLHGEQELHILKKLPVGGSFEQHTKIVGLYDKGKGALLVIETSTKCPKTGETFAKAISGAFIRGLTNFGGERGPAPVLYNPPNRAPDAVSEFKTSEDQAIFYRLSGDYNPLHIDPAVAKKVAFPKPILHGLCSFGVAARTVIATFCNNDTSKFKGIKVRFASPVFPGETLLTEMWKEGNDVIFQMKVKERNVVVINNAVVLLQQDEPEEPKSKMLFEAMPMVIEENKWLLKRIDAIYEFRINCKPKNLQYTVDLKKGKVIEGVTKDKPDCIFSMSDEDYYAMSLGELNSQQAFESGKLKIEGDKVKAQKLALLQQAAIHGEKFLKSAVLFEGMEYVIKQRPDLAKKINGVFQFDLSGPVNATYTVDLKQGRVYQGPAQSKADCVFVMKDDDYFDMATGSINPQRAFMTGKLKIKGNLMLAQKLQLLQAAAAKL